MPRGFPISFSDRKRIAILRVQLDYSVEDIHAIFLDRVSFPYLQRICSLLDARDDLAVHYLLGPRGRSFNRSNRRLTDFQQLYLVDVLQENVQYRLNYLTENFISECFSDETTGPSVSTV